MIQADDSGIFHPNTEADIIDLIQFANTHQSKIRIIGSGESLQKTVNQQAATLTTLTETTSHQTLLVQLNQFRKVEINADTLQVIVGAGCNLGFDPYDPSETSQENDSNNFYKQLDDHGLAIANVPASLHQSVSGFMLTGASGGTMQHSFEECILAIRIIDGTGKVQTFTRSNNPDDPFFAVGVSLGLLGVITEITLQCIASFRVMGNEATTDTQTSEYNFLATTSDQRPTLQDYLINTEFTRILWWPYKTLNRLITWQARTMGPVDFTPDRGTPGHLIPKPYQPLFPEMLGTPIPSEMIASSAFQLIATWPDWFYQITGNPSNEAYSGGLNKLKPVLEWIFPYVYPLLTDMFFPINTPKKLPQQFWDNWLGSLPMDKVEFSNQLFNLEYTELWFPIEKTSQVIQTLQQYYTSGGYTATGFYTVEIMAGKKSDCWLSPAYQTNSLRLNFMFFKNSSHNAVDFFAHFWDLFAENNIDFRPQWGKDLPSPDSRTGSAYLQSQYPKWNDFMKIRNQMDPNNVFLTDYWKTSLGIIS
jgi:hypothetical protein